MKKNLILISLDTLRADVAYSGKFPTIERIREKSVSFTNTISSAPITPISHASVLSGKHPYNHGIRHLFQEQLNSDTKTIASILKKEGYTTGAIVSCPGMNDWYNLSMGFDHYDDEIPRLADGTDPLETVDVKKRGTALKRADLVVERASQWVLEHGKNEPFFLFTHFFDTHWPYEAPTIFGGDNIYENEVAYMDHHLGTFFDFLEKHVDMDNTTIICFSDHGEDLEGLYSNDKGGELLGHPEESGHGCLLYDQTQKVFLTVSDSSIDRKGNIEDQVRLIDIMPTIIDLLGIDYEKSYMDGLSLLPVINDEKKHNLVAYSETFYPEEQNSSTENKFPNAKDKKSVRIDNKYKVIFHLNSDLVEVYDIEKDPNEVNNLLKSK